ncbi:MAG: prefoldin subunit alpha [Thermoplasmata archaeon]|nr:prefoldin subunit alpha [Thermoplasmata archaeon]
MSASPQDLERRAQEDLYRLEAYRSQLNSMLQQHQMLTASRAEHVRARETLEGLDRLGDGTELLIPLGADTLLRGTTVPRATVLVGIGSGVVVEMERPHASEVLAQRLTKLEQAGEELEGQIRNLDERVQAISQRLEAMSEGAADADPRSAEHVGRN